MEHKETTNRIKEKSENRGNQLEKKRNENENKKEKTGNRQRKDRRSRREKNKKGEIKDKTVTRNGEVEKQNTKNEMKKSEGVEVIREGKSMIKKKHVEKRKVENVNEKVERRENEKQMGEKR